MVDDDLVPDMDVGDVIAGGRTTMPERSLPPTWKSNGSPVF